MKINQKVLIGVICICIAAVAVLAAMQHFSVPNNPSISSEPYVIEQEGESDNVETAEETPVPTEAPLPTSTPKPLPTATVTPIPTEIPPEPEFPEQVVEYNQNDQGSDVTGVIGQNGLPADPNGQDNGDQPADGPFVLKNMLFIGDERTQAMINVSTNGSDLWECTNGGGCNWFLNNAISDVNNYVTNGTAVVIALGMNDINNAASYVAAINAQAQVWAAKGAKTYFVAVGPVDATSYILNTDIMNFNTALYQQLNVPFIDLYNYLVQTGFATVDGQLYDSATSSIAYNYISECVQAG